MDKDFLVSCIEQGLSVYKIAKKFGKSPTTIQYWLKKYGLKTKYKSFKNGYHGERKGIDEYFCTSCGIQITKENGYKRTEKDRYGFVTECKKCISNKTKLERKRNKERAIEYKGGCCNRCGYDKNIATLEFHHLDPSQKEISPSNLTNSDWELLKEEIDKCILLCSNCHREEHQRIDDKTKLENNFKPFQLNDFSDKILTGGNTGKTSCYVCDIVVTEENIASKKHTPLCKSCNSKRTIKREKDGKKRCVDYMGGCCSICGYDKCIRALEFHHLDPSKKSKEYRRRFKLWNFERQKKELENCIIVCSNCHREIHNQ
jgi:transposase-like protein